MKPSVTFVFILLFIVVCGAYYYLAPDEQPPVELAAPAPMKLMELDENDVINFIQIQNQEEKETITLKKSDEQWMIKYPIEYPANHLMVEGLVTALTLSKKARRLVPEKGLEEYGLQNPSMKIGVETEQSPKRRYLYFGDSTPVGNYVFSKWENEDDYFLLDEHLKKAFNRSVYSLRLTRVFRTPLDSVIKIRFRGETEEYEISSYGDKWFWMEPIPILGEVLLKSDRDKILTQLIDLNVKDFQDDEKRKQHELGFSILSPSIKLWKDEGTPEILLLGREMPTRDAYFGVRENEDVFFLVAKPNVDQLFHSVEEIAGRYLQQGKSTQNLLA